ncbi:nucleolar protein [Theileria orientalis]|uniref:Nucleolar protein n=1 Tax=Theileria orientalis TaxID=68886 RepID=A0A976QS25_THEOR|nr:nucleolar protein [Theileria orientalis]
MPSSKKTIKNNKSTQFDDDSISLSPKIVDRNYSTDDVLVKWLRDVDIFKSNSNVNKACYGIDASSAAVVDALRLKRLSGNDQAWILDMCCAPGGKLLATVSSLSKFKGSCKWNVVGLDSVRRRLDVCRSMLRKENYNSDKIKVILHSCRSQEFCELGGDPMFGRFDRVILDVECTHEGSLRSVIRTIKYWGIDSLESKWTKEYASKIVSNQRELLHQAIKLVKPGGLIVYSTCSLDREQNELLVSQVVNGLDNIKFYPLPVNSCSCCSLNSEERPESWPSKSCTALLRENCSDDIFYRPCELDVPCKNADSPVAVRFVPLEGETDGLYICVLIRTG